MSVTARNFDGVKMVSSAILPNGGLIEVGDILDFVSSSDTSSRLLIFRSGNLRYSINMAMDSDALVGKVSQSGPWFVFKLKPGNGGKLDFGEVTELSSDNIMGDNGGSTGDGLPPMT